MMASVRSRVTRPVDNLQARSAHDAGTRDAIFMPRAHAQARRTEPRSSPLFITSGQRKPSYDASQAALTPTMKSPQLSTVPDSLSRSRTFAAKESSSSANARKRRGGCFSPPIHALDQMLMPFHAEQSLGASPDRSGNRQISACNWQVKDSSDIVLAEESSIAKASSPVSPIVYPELDRYGHLNSSEQQPTSGHLMEAPCQLATSDVPLQTPVSLCFASSSQASATSGTPSTWQSFSPCSAPVSRDSTPTSVSSQSSVTVTPGRMAAVPRNRNPATTRPPVTRRRTGSASNNSEIASASIGGLDAVRECATSSSSASTVCDGDKTSKDNKTVGTPLQSSLPGPVLGGSGTDTAKNHPKSPATYIGSSITSSPRLSQSPTKSTVSPRVPQAASPKPGPPQRPSREGTQDMEPQFLETVVPVIRSNLSPISRAPLRRESEPVNAKSRGGSPSHLSQSKKNFSTPHLPLARNASSTDLKKLLSHERAQSSQISASKNGSSFSSRFAFFTRKKSKSDDSKCEAQKAQSRKGPVAGTGHEGYGKVGAPGRRVANSPRSPPISLASGDSFLADRVCPVVIAGGEVIENHNTNPELSRLHNSPPLASNARCDGRSVAAPRDGQNQRRPSGSSTKDGKMMESTLAFRRSIQRPRATPDDIMRLPQPINTRISSSSSSSVMASADTSIASAKSNLDKIVSRESGDTQSTANKRRNGGRSPRRWNLFGRSQARSRSTNTEDKVQATIAAVEEKPVAFYTMMDPTEQGCGAIVDDIQQVLRDAEVFPPISDSPDLTMQRAPGSKRCQDWHSLKSPSSYSLKTAQRNVPLRRQSPGLGNDKSKFSTDAGRPRQESGTRSLHSENSKDGIPLKPGQLNRCKGAKTTTLGDGQPATSPGQSVIDGGSESGFPPDMCERIIADSELVSSPRAICPFTQATAVVPSPGDPPVEDEIWDEYDDLLEEDHTQRPFKQSSQALKLTKCSSPHESKVGDYKKSAEQATGSTLRSSARKSGSDCDKTVSLKWSTSSSDEGSPLAQFNLRVGSITASKWLTFGHLLFSDIRHELAAIRSPLTRPSILVMDGLGNDDWSYFASEAYPAASFYNLSPRERPSFEQQASLNVAQTPANHFQVKYTCLMDKFPFAAQSFSCMVYRFPTAAPESHYRNVINEARRVLRPGGYIELSILDVDLNNMGHCARKAVRGLKERVHSKAARVSLASTADVMVRLLGRAGFSHIKAARVGVPIASKVGGKPDAPLAKGQAKQASSLADMMSDDSPTADEHITRIVSRVGRWWYTRCYESAARMGDRSIWADKALLSECEELGTSLKLLVCCARAPDRMISV